MAYNIRVHNPAPYEVVFDMQGRIIDGHSSRDGDRNDRLTARLLSRGALLEVGQISALAFDEPEMQVASTPKSRTTTNKSTATAGAETGEK